MAKSGMLLTAKEKNMLLNEFTQAVIKATITGLATAKGIDLLSQTASPSKICESSVTPFDSPDLRHARADIEQRMAALGIKKPAPFVS